MAGDRPPNERVPDEKATWTDDPRGPRTNVAPISALPRSPFNGNAVAGGSNPFDTWHVEPTAEQREAMDNVVGGAQFFAWLLLRHVPASPERTLAMRALMECVFQANYAITHSEVR